MGLLLLTAACNSNSEKKENIAPTEESNAHSVLFVQKAIAKRYGYDNWNTVNKIAFTFNVDRGENHFERSYIWKPKTGAVQYMGFNDTISYIHPNPLDSVQVGADQAFINDKYWLLAPFQLLWDKDLKFEGNPKAIAPISKDTLGRLTIVYPNEGGYTPGDAYDFYYDKDFTVKEWVFRETNHEAPSMMRTWEQPETINDIVFTTQFLDSTSSAKLYFTNISVK